MCNSSVIRVTSYDSSQQVWLARVRVCMGVCVRARACVCVWVDTSVCVRECVHEYACVHVRVCWLNTNCIAEYHTKTLFTFYSLCCPSRHAMHIIEALLRYDILNISTAHSYTHKRTNSYSYTNAHTYSRNHTDKHTSIRIHVDTSKKVHYHTYIHT